MDCEYDAPEGLSQREAEKKRLKELSQSKENLQSTLEILRHGSEADAIAALRRIRDAGQVEDAVTMIADAQALLPQTNSTSSASSSPPRRRAPSDLLLHDPTADQDYMFETRYSWTQERDVDKNVFINLAGQTLDIARWTTVSSDNRLMNHLLNLFFTWDNCMERMMYRPMFEEDLTSGPLPNDNTPRLQFCSAFLVNALLAMSCVSADASTSGRAGLTLLSSIHCSQRRLLNTGILKVEVANSSTKLRSYCRQSKSMRRYHYFKDCSRYSLMKANLVPARKPSSTSCRR